MIRWLAQFDDRIAPDWPLGQAIAATAIVLAAVVALALGGGVSFR